MRSAPERGCAGAGRAGLLLWCALLAGPSSAEIVGSPAVTELRYGLVCPVDPAGVTREGAEDTLAGQIDLLSEPPPIVSEGPVIPAAPGYAMALQGRLVGPNDTGTVTVTWTHPPMGPDGVTRQSTIGRLSADGVFHRGYGFDLPMERQPGAWTVTIEAERGILATARFSVVSPDTRPDLVALCAGDMLS